MSAINEIIHQSMRLKIMAALNALRPGSRLEFQELKSLLSATDGNLGTHLATLEGAGYIAVEKDFVGKKPRTRVAITRTGRRAFEQHVDYLRDVINASSATV
jgi:DNA-binding MarR family transcriptional regulator